VDSSTVYGDIDFNYYQDNENTGDNNDNDNAPKPEEGDVSRDNDPRQKLPATMRENYGIAIVHNLSKTMPLMKVSFDLPLQDGTSIHWEMNPGPDKGTQKSIILRPGLWTVRAIWLDPADPDRPYGTITTTILKAGAANYLNHLYFYKGTDGKWHLTAEQDDSLWNPPIDNGDYDPNGGGNTGSGGANLDGEGEYTNENEGVDTGTSWWDNLTNRNNFGILVVKNITYQAYGQNITFTFVSNAGRTYNIGNLSPRSEKSVILGAGGWKVNMTIVTPGGPVTKEVTKTVLPLGITGKFNYIYIYKDGANNTDYNVWTGQEPPTNNVSDQGGGGTSQPGYVEGNSPGALTEANRSTLGLLVLKNISPDVAVDYARFEQSPKDFNMFPGPDVRDQRSILLGPGQWEVTAYYTKTGSLQASTQPKNVIIQAGQVSYMYFYKTATGYALTDSWSPVPGDALSDNEDPGTIIGENEGWLHVINSSNTAILNRVQYNNGSSWIDLDIPNATHTIEPRSESDPDLVVTAGNYAFRFKTLTKETYSRAVSRTIRPGQITTVEYTDALDSDEPPDGYGTLRIINASSSTVYEVKSFLAGTNPPSEGTEVNITPGTSGALILPAPAANNDYIVRSYITSPLPGKVYVEHQVTIENQKIKTITITDGTNTGTETGGSSATVRVYNNYDDYENRAAAGTLRPVLPVRIFKIALIGTNTQFLGGGTANDKIADGSIHLEAGEFRSLQITQAGNYTLYVTWGNVSFADTANNTRTEIGSYYLSPGTARNIYVDLYSLNLMEGEAPVIRFNHVGYPGASPVSQLQVYTVVTGSPDFGMAAHANNAGWAGSSPESKWIVYQNNAVFQSGQGCSFKLVSGRTYYVRAKFTIWDCWVGTGGGGAALGGPSLATRFLKMDLNRGNDPGYITFAYDDLDNEMRFAY
jgi:hypothetical protein